MPSTVGIAIEPRAILRPDSLFIVIIVVAQGKWNKVKINRFTQVKADQSADIPSMLYPDKINGKTSSFAGNPSRKAHSITPSSPIDLPSGSSITNR